MAGRNILVADEDFDTRVILRAILQRNGYNVIDAATADEAVLAAQSDHFDLIILNYPMSNVQGSTLVQQIRVAMPDQHVPILNLTSRVVPHFLQQAAAEGVDVSLAKPVEVDQVLEVVHQLTRPPRPTSATI